MEESTPKEKILKKIRQALLHKAPNPYSNLDLEKNVFQPDDRDLKLQFASHFTQIAGQFIYCENQFDYIDHLISVLDERDIRKVFCLEENLRAEFEDTGLEFSQNLELIADMDAGISTCEALVARTGSILLSSKKNGRQAAAYPPVHIVKAYTSQLVPDIKDAFQLLRNQYGNKLPSVLCFETGPSRTSDIERSLVIGAQGPRELYVFLIDNGNKS